MFSLSRFSRGGFIPLDFKVKASSYAAWMMLTVIGKTLRLHVEGENQLMRFQENKQPVILAGWHGRMFVPIYYLRNRSIYGIVSPSRDGKYFAGLFSRFGWGLVFGSSRKGGVSALRGSIKVLRDGGVLAVTPDGPMGPKEKAHPGVVYLASHTQAPIIPVGISSHPCRVLGTWDASMLPLPFAQSCIIFGEAFSVPPKLKSDNIESHVLQLEQCIHDVTAKADMRTGFIKK